MAADEFLLLEVHGGERKNRPPKLPETEILSSHEPPVLVQRFKRFKRCLTSFDSK